MSIAACPRRAILARLVELESELKQARDDLRNLQHRDAATTEVVTRGARLSRERTSLEMRLAQLARDDWAGYNETYNL